MGAGAGVPPFIQSIVWSVVLTGLFVIGGLAVLVTASKTVKSFKDDNDSLSAKALQTLVIGSIISAAFLLGGSIGMIAFGGKILQGFGIG
ncbi:Uncharacterised protein [Mycobacteroides abscessus subsp. abscessus]|uniref:hypothetical protein n=1 Tax=Mycobacteroides abscessus TaxID=36809 RepID=UPI000929E868|nr:hypothetical protein [Mycobacteroides abscessus]SHU29566.1 Uncharacterised protein [Mycobacteroides abscessus subsp. abscessus]